MNSLLISIVAATLGWQYGWQPLPEGGTEYIIQLDDEAIAALRGGQVIQSDIPSGAGEVRSYRIFVGNKKLPHDAVPPRPATPSKPPVENTSKQEPAKPWLPLTLTLLGLFGSLAANVYLGWLAIDFRRRCLAMPNLSAGMQNPS